jgi:hypothetical protein
MQRHHTYEFQNKAITKILSQHTALTQRRAYERMREIKRVIMLLDLKSLSSPSLHVKEDFRKGKDGFCLGLNRRHQ